MFRVVGTVASIQRFGANLGFDWNAFALVPATVVAQPPAMLVILSDGLGHHPEIEARIRRLLGARHQLTEDFDLFDFGKLIDTFFTAFRILEWLVVLLAGIALVVAAFGIFNAQAASLRQRILDSGIRLALGAPRAALAVQMVFESATAGPGWGDPGRTPGPCLLPRRRANHQPLHPGWMTALAPDLALAGCVAALIVGCVSGVLPARRAVRLDVVECLRSR